MGLSTFIGGVHPYEGKELSSDKPIQVIQPKGELVFPLSQHIGAPAKPLVAKGDTVLAGQKIAEGRRLHFCQCDLFCIRDRKGDRAPSHGQRQHGAVHYR